MNKASYFKLEDSINTKRHIVDAMIDFVLDFGEDFHGQKENYYRTEFDIKEDKADGDTKVLKVLDMRYNGGCVFPRTKNYRIDNINKDEEYLWIICSYEALYVVEEGGHKELKIHMSENSGIERKAEFCEEANEYAENLLLQELEKIANCMLDCAALNCFHNSDLTNL